MSLGAFILTEIATSENGCLKLVLIAMFLMLLVGLSALFC